MGEKDTNGSQEEAGRYCVYRFYDAAGILLYVGQSCRFAERASEHRRNRDWWHEVADIGVIHCPHRGAADALEQRLIRSLKPAYNVRHNGQPSPASPNGRLVMVEKPQEIAIEVEPWLSMAQMAKHLRVGDRWIKDRVEEGLPCTHVGKYRRFKASAVDEWIEGR